PVPIENRESSMRVSCGWRGQEAETGLPSREGSGRHHQPWVRGGSGRMPSPGGGLCAAFATSASALRAQAVELFLELDLQPALDRRVVHALAHGVRETGLAERHAAVGVVVVLVALRI